MLGGPTGPACCPLSFLSSLPCFYLDLFSYPFSYFFPSFLLLSSPLLSLLDASNPFVTLFHPFPFESFVARIRVRVRVSVNVRVSVGISTLLFVRLSLPLSPNTYALPQPPILCVSVRPVVGPFSEFVETFDVTSDFAFYDAALSQRGCAKRIGNREMARWKARWSRAGG